MNLSISEETYQQYLDSRPTISDKRIRPEDQSLFEALTEVELPAEYVEALKNLK